jgi:hypothetical protein
MGQSCAPVWLFVLHMHPCAAWHAPCSAGDGPEQGECAARCHRNLSLVNTHWSTEAVLGSGRHTGGRSLLVPCLHIGLHRSHRTTWTKTPLHTHTHTSHHKAGRACRCHWSQSAPATPTAAHSMNTGNPSHLQSHVTPFSPCKHRLSGRYMPAPPPALSTRGAQVDRDPPSTSPSCCQP